VYPEVAYKYVRQAIEEAEAIETWAVFQKLDLIMRRRYAMTQFSAPLWARVLNIHFVSDLERIIQEVLADADVAAG